MKQIKILSLIAVVILMILSQSCKKGILEGVNDNPNSPAEVTPRVLLPGAEGNLAYAQGGDVERYAGVMVQYITGAFRQFGAYQSYIFTEEDFNNLWNNLFAATMQNYKTIMDLEAASPGTLNTYDAIARIQMAYTLALTTDLWGDIPYAEAFQGNLNLSPVYQSQQSIYDSIQSLLTTGINELTNEPGNDFDAPDANDFIYEGNVGNWIALAHALKARYYLHLTQTDGSVNGAVSAQKALDEIALAGAIVDAGYPFSSSGPSPWFQYIDLRDDIIYSEQGALEGYGAVIPDPAVVATLIERDDPRYPVYIDVNGDQEHWAPGYLGAFFQADNASVWLMKYFEELFIEAEANLRIGNQAGAQSSLQAAIQASFDFYGLDESDSAQHVADSTYIATYAVLTGNFSQDLETIITEKWIANYLHPESYVDFRRTGFPVLTPNLGTEIPVRFIYPTNEHLYNPQGSLPNGGDNLSSTLFAPRLWWDQ